MLYANITCSMSNRQSFGVSYYVSWSVSRGAWHNPLHK